MFAAASPARGYGEDRQAGRGQPLYKSLFEPAQRLSRLNHLLEPRRLTPSDCNR